jgi:hypothetical protein
MDDPTVPRGDEPVDGASPRPPGHHGSAIDRMWQDPLPRGVAIGVSGAPGGQFDEECAGAALAEIQDRMK